ncbi:unnamed protein product [Rangifer tarandus platyrhynchus]|uniref:Uncharacterized protein n=1 Tax=Rangifer tarandus platyrhynchus TaxID=3082113 RepID=A0ABN8Y028_RANTA|nr:unnamed protein product [Rangifer tarandus platyrhynchus]
MKQRFQKILKAENPLCVGNLATCSLSNDTVCDRCTQKDLSASQGRSLLDMRRVQPGLRSSGAMVGIE